MSAMSRASIIFLLCLFSFTGMAQDNSGTRLAAYAERARLFGERIPQEKVYVQMDVCPRIKRRP